MLSLSAAPAVVVVAETTVVVMDSDPRVVAADPAVVVDPEATAVLAVVLLLTVFVPQLVAATMITIRRTAMPPTVIPSFRVRERRFHQLRFLGCLFIF